jgi:hypothetical protein
MLIIVTFLLLRRASDYASLVNSYCHLNISSLSAIEGVEERADNPDNRSQNPDPLPAV